MEAPSNKTKEQYGNMMSEWAKSLRQHTCLIELIKIRYAYKKGQKQDIFADIQQVVAENFKPIFTDCVSRSKDETYPVVLEYAMMVWH